MRLGLVDTVYVVSLKESADRRDFIARHFAAFGMMDKLFFAACGADSPKFRELCESCRVGGFSHCIRCGKADRGYSISDSKPMAA